MVTHCITWQSTNQLCVPVSKKEGDSKTCPIIPAFDMAESEESGDRGGF